MANDIPPVIDPDLFNAEIIGYLMIPPASLQDICRFSG
jgi:hypothetical protein